VFGLIWLTSFSLMTSSIAASWLPSWTASIWRHRSRHLPGGGSGSGKQV